MFLYRSLWRSGMGLPEDPREARGAPRKLWLLSVPTTCRTANPIQLTLNYDGPLSYPLAFDGTTTIPSLTGCGLLGPTLGALLSGPGNAYHVTLAPPS